LNNCLGVGFGGGEPTLHPNFVEICKKTYQNTHMAVTFTTHGHTLNEDLINQLKPYVHFIRVSVDGVGANYERIRGVSFSNLNDKLKLLQGKIKYGVNFVVNDTTIHDIEELVSLIEKLGAEELLFLPEVPVGRGKAVSENAIAFLYEWIKNYTGSLRLAISSDTRQEGLPICSFSRESSTLESYAHIDATGTLKLSSYDNIGVKIKGRSIIEGLDELKKFEVVKRDKNMDRLRV
jgi:MoaA/NifB/PqqE/SkfB family radical SAM enzyme